MAQTFYCPLLNFPPNSTWQLSVVTTATEAVMVNVTVPTAHASHTLTKTIVSGESEAVFSLPAITNRESGAEFSLAETGDFMAGQVQQLGEALSDYCSQITHSQ